MEKSASPLGSVRRWIWMRGLLWVFPAVFSLSTILLMNLVHKIVRTNDGQELAGIALLSLGGIIISAWLHAVFTMRIRAGTLSHPAAPTRPPFLRFFLLQLLIVPAVLTLWVILAIIILRPVI